MKSKLQLAGVALVGLMSCAQAADHRDGPLATGDPTADINDVYLFMNPNNANEVILGTTIIPFAGPATRFSDAVQYRFHIDNGAASGGTTTITCTFTNSGNSYSCTNGGNLSVSGRHGETTVSSSMRAFVGLRDDPFFFDLDAFNRTRAAVSLQFTNPGVNFFRTANTMAIVFGIDKARLTNNGANPTLRVYASTNRIGDTGISAGHSGMWYDAANPGHGLIVQTLAANALGPNTPRQMVAYWNVFDNSGNQLALFGLGPINNDRVTIPFSSGSGGRFPPAFMSSQVTTTPFGDGTLTFTSCNNATFAVTPTRAGFGATTINLTRLSGVENQNCTFLSSGQIDRMGRPAINTAAIDLLASTGKKDQYNRASDPTTWASLFTAEITANLTALDTLDGATNAILPPGPLAGVLVDDRLVINTGVGTCDEYLAVELGVAGKCGGRTLARDVIDDTTRAVVGPTVIDNVGNDTTFLTDFPFMAPPQ